MPSTSSRACDICSDSLAAPFVKCCVCENLVLCRNCFSKGREKDQHKSDHSYGVYREDFTLFESSSWTAAEELKLLDAIQENGFGNWAEVSKSLQSKDSLECERHYDKFYIIKQHPQLPEFNQGVISAYSPPLVCRYGERPLRPAAHSLLLSEMAGYMPARGDFASEYDNYAELDLRDLEFVPGDEPAVVEMKMATLRIYVNKLKERHRRKNDRCQFADVTNYLSPGESLQYGVQQSFVLGPLLFTRIIRDYGLINLQQVAHTSRRYLSTLKPHQLDTLKACVRLLHPVDFDKYLEALSYEVELRRDIRKLQKYRALGLRRSLSSKVFERLLASRESGAKKRHHLADVLSHLQDKNACQLWLQRQSAAASASAEKGGRVPLLPLPSAPRKAAPPLDISGMPGYELLSVKEREVCSVVRLVPNAYLEFKKLLMAESKKMGSLRLAQARVLIKIDVNKTRKLFDFLSDEGLIVKEN